MYSTSVLEPSNIRSPDFSIVIFTLCRKHSCLKNSNLFSDLKGQLPTYLKFILFLIQQIPYLKIFLCFHNFYIYNENYNLYIQYNIYNQNNLRISYNVCNLLSLHNLCNFHSFHSHNILYSFCSQNNQYILCSLYNMSSLYNLYNF